MQFCVSCEVCSFQGLLSVLPCWVRALEEPIFVREFFQLVKNPNFCANPRDRIFTLCLNPSRYVPFLHRTEAAKYISM